MKQPICKVCKRGMHWSEEGQVWVHDDGWNPAETAHAAVPDSELVLAPEDCPESFWHETHLYCPRCSWTAEPDEPTENHYNVDGDLVIIEKTLLRQVGWQGQTGTLYRSEQEARDGEQGGYSPAYIVTAVDHGAGWEE